MLQYSYAYDNLGQLTRENNLPANRTYLYSYDKDGNMLSKTEGYYSLAVVTPIGTTYFTYDGTKSDCLTKITFPDGKVFSTYYSSIGNPAHIITENGNTMAAMWSYGRRLTMVVAGPDMFTYDYNADGIRTTKTVNGVKHTYALSGTTILNEEWTENGVQHLLMYVYDANGSPVGMVYRNSTMAANASEEYLFVKNIQGDILHVYNSAGKKLVSYVYDAWGNIISTTYSNGGGTSAARFNPFTYRGYYRDSETGMYYLNSRYYNPRMGRFISADNQLSGGDLLGYNLYAYCGNNPVNKVDPNGEFGWIIWVVVAVVAVAITTSVIAEVSMPSKEMHYSRNDNNLIDMPRVEDVPNDWKTSDPKKYPEHEKGPAANAHNFSSPDRSNVKFVSPDGRMEAIYDSDGWLVTNPKDTGTYNYCPSENSIWGHYVNDVKSWIRWGNSPDDTTTPFQRMFGLIGVYWG